MHPGSVHTCVNLLPRGQSNGIYSTVCAHRVAVGSRPHPVIGSHVCMQYSWLHTVCIQFSSCKWCWRVIGLARESEICLTRVLHQARNRGPYHPMSQLGWVGSFSVRLGSGALWSGLTLHLYWEIKIEIGTWEIWGKNFANVKLGKW